jgi:hypothetical protein
VDPKKLKKTIETSNAQSQSVLVVRIDYDMFNNSIDYINDLSLKLYELALASSSSTNHKEFLEYFFPKFKKHILGIDDGFEENINYIQNNGISERILLKLYPYKQDKTNEPLQKKKISEINKKLKEMYTNENINFRNQTNSKQDKNTREIIRNGNILILLSEMYRIYNEISKTIKPSGKTIRSSEANDISRRIKQFTDSVIEINYGVLFFKKTIKEELKKFTDLLINDVTFGGKISRYRLTRRRRQVGGGKISHYRLTRRRRQVGGGKRSHYRLTRRRQH